MIENLLHSQIVLSKKVTDQLRSSNVAVESNIAGEITLIGQEEDTWGEPNTIHLLIRFDPQLIKAFTAQSMWIPADVIGRTVGSAFEFCDFSVLTGQDVVNEALVKMKLEVSLRNPQGFLHANARRVGSKLLAALYDQWLDDESERESHEFYNGTL